MPAAPQNNERPPAYTASGPVDTLEKPSISARSAVQFTLSKESRAAMARKQFKDARQARGTDLRGVARELENQVAALPRDMDGEHWREHPKFKDITEALARLDKQTGTRHWIPLASSRGIYLAADGFRVRHRNVYGGEWTHAKPTQAAKIALLRLDLAERGAWARLSRPALEGYLADLPDVMEPVLLPNLSIKGKIGNGVRKGLLFTVLSPLAAGVAIWAAHETRKRWLKLAHKQGER